MARICIVVFLFLIVGCAAVGPPKQSDEIAIKAEKKSIVIFRFSGTIDGKQINEEDFFIELANVDRYEIPKKYHVKSFPSEDARKKGWTYLVLEPGMYYFTVTPGYLSQDDGPESLDADTGRISRSVFGSMTTMSAFWFNLPKGVPVLYIGTVSFSCAGIEGQQNATGYCTDVNVQDETGLAGDVAGTLFAQYGRMVTTILKRYGACDRQEANKLRPFGAEVAAHIGLDPFDLIQISPDRVAGPGYGYLAGLPPGMPFSPLFYPDGFLYGYGPYNTGAGAGLYIYNVWWPCFDKIAEEITNANLTGMFEDVLMKSGNKDHLIVLTNRYNTEATGNRNGLLQIDIQKARLIECDETWTFCTEIEVRARLFNPATGKYICDSIFRYSNSKNGRPRGQGRYVLPVRKTSPCLYLDAWCGPEGSSIINEKIAEAIQSISDKIVSDLGIRD